MKVKEVMKEDVIKVKRSTSLKELLMFFKDFHTLPLIPVVDEENFLIGVVYLGNLLEILKSPQVKFLKNVPFAEVDEDMFDLELAPTMGDLILVDDIMDTHCVSLKEDASLEEAYKVMRLHNREQLPVVDKDNRLLGIIGIFDIVWKMFQQKGVV
ncbi:MAG TPA: CBS domain-containing protein [Candidatus Omnitrophica bacterium]|nr:CBS domain-containing protein [Candidatus Omnitrophota bacterium]